MEAAMEAEVDVVQPSPVKITGVLTPDLVGYPQDDNFPFFSMPCSRASWAKSLEPACRNVAPGIEEVKSGMGGVVAREMPKCRKNYFCAMKFCT